MEEGTCQARDRVFYTIPEKDDDLNKQGGVEKDKEDLLKYVSSNILGKDKVFSGPFGLRRGGSQNICKGIALKFIEDYIQNEVLPDYGNTHTTTSITSLQTTLYRHEARDIIRNSVHASEHDSVIFCGSGTTGAVHKLLHGLDLKTPPIVFVGPYEHHSSFLPWTEFGAKIIRIKEDPGGGVNIGHLNQQLKKYQNSGCQLIGCFSAASNITGILVDVNTVTIALHKAGALAFWDYATAAPYVKIDMNPVVISSEEQPYVYKDAVFLSTHKFIGGVQTPGVLIAKKKLFKNKIPEKCGGGSVFYVRREGHRFLQEPELREEGGTPAIVEAVRAGMVFQLKNAITPEVIMEKEQQLFSIGREAWKDCPNLVLLGDLTPERLPIFSFLVYQPDCGRFLHYNFVASLLNDLFGIQARGGCACAGPYAMDLLGLNETTATEIEELLAEDDRLDRTHLRRYREYSHREIVRPGFVRINLPYFMDKDTMDFVIEAVKLVAQHGWKLLPQYMFNPETGEWRQKNFQVFKDRKWLGHIKYGTGKMEYKVPPFIVKGELPKDYQDCLEKAKSLFIQAGKTKYQLPDHSQMFDDKAQKYRWFLLPSEAALFLHGNHVSNYATKLPFCPPKLRLQIGLPPFILGEEDSSTDVIYEGKSQGLENSGSNTMHEGNSEESFRDKMIENIDRGFSENLVDSAKNHDTAIHVTPHHEKNDVKQSTESNTLDQTSPESCDRKPAGESSFVSTEINNYNCDLNDINRTALSLNSNPKQGSGNECETTCNPDNKDTSAEIDMKSDFCSLSKKRSLCSDQKFAIDSSSNCSVSKQRRTEAIIVSEKSVESKVCDNNGKEVCDKKDSKAQGKDKKLCKWFSPPKTIFTPFLKALEEYKMIRDGDRILVCLSGGKDSLSLLHTIRQYQFYSKSKGVVFEFGAVTVDPQTPSYDPSPLKQYLASLGVPYFYESQCIMEQAQSLEDCASICSFCSRMKRGRIYACARRNGYNVLALGQHLDDLAESFLMSFFHNGILRTMKAHYDVEERDLRVIRPFVYAEREGPQDNKLPVIAENCPACFEAPKERHRTKQLLAAQEILFPQIYNSMMAAMKPIMGISKTGIKVKDYLTNGQGSKDSEEDDMDF
ncbi:hypothetical protein FSP39_016852 [Pinctada imbricata]|uniref:Uncharacterized protein n=1 Tax=Pinctada imbricata TaxID=66713 RepID=A0AA88Y7V2_PINIB|nr:hypothetical protein FSP39_016852 [Pinctada imbricata]